MNYSRLSKLIKLGSPLVWIDFISQNQPCQMIMKYKKECKLSQLILFEYKMQIFPSNIQII